ncbi:MAG TPA: uracil-DNA glycosylase [Devosiaceae bacterium]|jgi:DNA polymerase|nr:uracil-DNA glycosylase [Devosiaceae bacterium]
MSGNRPLNAEDLLPVLDWYRAVGVDLAVADEPIDRFASSAAAPRARPAAEAEIPLAAAPAAPAETMELAAGAQTMEQLRAVMEAYEGCALKKRATQLCFADGNPEADIMLVGEGPGEQEDLAGTPFVGRAGQLLDRMLAAIGLDRTKVFIANMVPWRPPGNREPSPEELALCLPFLYRQVELVAPKFLVTLGNVPTRSLFGTTQGITRTRGQWRELTINGHSMRALPMLHPAYLLRMPGSKALAWRDLISLRQAIAGESPPGG